jgi:hypothetical protein
LTTQLVQIYGQHDGRRAPLLGRLMQVRPDHGCYADMGAFGWNLHAESPHARPFYLWTTGAGPCVIIVFDGGPFGAIGHAPDAQSPETIVASAEQMRGRLPGPPPATLVFAGGDTQTAETRRAVVEGARHLAPVVRWEIPDPNVNHVTYSSAVLIPLVRTLLLYTDSEMGFGNTPLVARVPDILFFGNEGFSVNDKEQRT